MGNKTLDEIFNVSGWDEENLSIIKEAPDDEPTGGEDAPPEDNADNNAEDAPPQDQQQEDQEEGNQDNADQQDNFDIDSDNTGGEEGEQDQEGEDQGNPEGNEDDQTETDNETSEESQNLKDKYDQLYANLTPEEKAYRNMVLKNEYKNLYTLCGSILVQTGYFPNIAESQDVLKRIIKSLQNFRKYIEFYITNIYDTKSFYENKYQYEVYLQIFNGIKSIFKDFENMMSHIDEKTSKNGTSN